MKMSQELKQGVKEKGLESSIFLKGRKSNHYWTCWRIPQKVDPESIEVDPAVEKVMHVSEPYKLANRAFHPEDSVIDVGGVKNWGRTLSCHCWTMFC